MSTTPDARPLPLRRSPGRTVHLRDVVLPNTLVASDADRISRSLRLARVRSSALTRLEELADQLLAAPPQRRRTA